MQENRVKYLLSTAKSSSKEICSRSKILIADFFLYILFIFILKLYIYLIFNKNIKIKISQITNHSLSHILYGASSEHFNVVDYIVLTEAAFDDDTNGKPLEVPE